MLSKLKKNRQLIHEFFRYVLVGGLAYIIDFFFLFLANTFLFSHLGNKGILIAASLGFSAGLIFNFILSFSFVFKIIDENANRNRRRSFIIFLVTGLTGLLITELLMFLGINIFGAEWYLVVKIFIAGIVLIWNYAMRKMFIFKGVKFVK